MKLFKYFLLACTLMANSVSIAAQDKMCKSKEQIIEEVSIWLKSINPKSPLEDRVARYVTQSAQYSVSFAGFEGNEDALWFGISLSLPVSSASKCDTTTNEAIGNVWLGTPYKIVFNDDSLDVFIQAMYPTPDSFLSVFPYYLDDLDSIAESIVADNAYPTRELERLASEMVMVNGGAFVLGEDMRYGKDKGLTVYPAHKVVLSSFWISKNEVTQSLWEYVMNDNPSQIKGSDRPVENVSWAEVNDFIAKLNTMTGCSYRLPTEAEWEYAARGGNMSKGFLYPGSDDCMSVAWMSKNSFDETHPVGQLKSNELGLYDMGGNVSEWCSDWAGDYSYVAENNPKGPSSGTKKIYRGGNWLSDEQSCQSSNRSASSVDSKSGTRGFRLAMDGDLSPNGMKVVNDGTPTETKPKDEMKRTDPRPRFIYGKVQINPTFKGGSIDKFSEWVKGMVGADAFLESVVVDFTVSVYGNVTNVKIVKGKDNALNKMIKKIVESSPNWIPGRNDGKLVPVTCRLILENE